jgi:hypothetical protein
VSYDARTVRLDDSTARNATRRPILLAGTGRGGTSWLLDLLSSEPDYRPVFEPLHPYNVPGAEPFYDLYVLESDDQPALERFFTDVFFGKPAEGWLRWMTLRTARNESVLRLLARSVYHYHRYKPFAQKRVVKIINGNLLLRWLAARLNPRIIFLIRHPCAVISSQRKMGWSLDVQRFLAQPRLVTQFLAPHVGLIEAAATPLEKLTVRWCIENVVPLTQMREGSLRNRPFFFEDLVREPEQTLDAILRHASMPEDEIARFIHRMKARMPPHPDTLHAWKRRLSGHEQRHILDVVARFGIDVYGDDPLPNPSSKLR